MNIRAFTITSVIAVAFGCGADGDDASALEQGGATDRRVVFVTADTFTGDLEGDAGADAACQSRATAAGLTGNFRAWLSGSSGDAAAKIADLRYVRTDGEVVATSSADLLDGTLNQPIDRDASGSEVQGDVWTGTRSDGSSAGADCDQWSIGNTSATGVCGSTRFTTANWTDNSVPRCNTPLHLFCFEQ